MSEKNQKVVSVLITIFSLIFVTFHLYTGYFGSLEVVKQRAIHLLLGLIILYLFSLKNSQTNREKVINIIAIIGVIGAIGYFFLRFEWIAVQRFPYVTPLSFLEIILGLLMIILVLDSVRRRVGNVLVYVVLVFLIYPFIGPYLPGVLQTRHIVWTDIIDLLYMTTGGILGVTIGVSSTTLAVFIIFGAFIAATGAGSLLFELSAAAVGKSRGGPAKMAVVGSALMGSINGAPAANVATIGVLTIPMMKKLGYKPEFAGAVEACSSIGGQFLPPVMGACAFLIVAFTGIPYVEIMKYALIPALIYFFSVFMTVHLEALKLGLQPVTATKTVREVLKEYGHMLIPIFILFYMLIKGYSPAMSGTLCTVFLVIISFVRKSTRLTISSFLSAVESAANGALVVITSCAAAGIVVGIIEYTGLGERLATSIVSMGGDNLLLVLFLVMIVSLILGMGMPPVPSYVLQVGLTIPALIEIGVPIYIAHLFVFYFCGLSLITPPVAVASYAAAGIANSDPMKTGFEAFRMAIPAFVVPFIFVLDPALLMVGSLGDIIIVTGTAIIAVCALAIAMEGYLYTKLNIVERLFALIASMLLILPYVSTAVPGLILIVIVVFFQRNKKMKENNPLSA